MWPQILTIYRLFNFSSTSLSALANIPAVRLRLMLSVLHANQWPVAWQSEPGCSGLSRGRSETTSSAGALPPQSAARDWPDGGMDGWVDERMSRSRRREGGRSINTWGQISCQLARGQRVWEKERLWVKVRFKKKKVSQKEKKGQNSFSFWRRKNVSDRSLRKTRRWRL